MSLKRDESGLAGAKTPSSPAAMQQLVDHAVAWAAVNGLGMVVKDPNGLFTTTHLPMSLLPNYLPEKEFKQAKTLARLFNKLVDNVGRDAAWLREVLAPVVEHDEFTARLLQILETIEAEGGPRQALRLGIHRSDYMLHAPRDGKTAPHLLQVELNTIASSFGCMSTLTGRMHKHLISRFAGPAPAAGGGGASSSGGGEGSGAGSVAPVAVKASAAALRAHLEALGAPAAASAATLAAMVPPNPALERLPAALAAAHAAYSRPAAVAVMVVQPGESNAFDQRLLEFGLWEHHGVPLRRMTLAEIAAQGRLVDGRLVVGSGGSGGGASAAAEGGVAEAGATAKVAAGAAGASAAAAEATAGAAEVSVVYYRAGYTPADYFGETEWAARLLVERSDAVKCPDIGYHLAGTKKVQQVLALPGQLERFMTPEEAVILRSCFAGLWSVGAEDDNATPAPGTVRADDAAAAAADALARPGMYVLKPQREGGGNNAYGAEVAHKLRTASAAELRSHILMQRIFPKVTPSILVRRGVATAGDAVSEWGIYSAFLGAGAGTTPLVNEYAGYLVRTKLEETDEGGVATGFAVLSSPLVVPGPAEPEREGN